MSDCTHVFERLEVTSESWVFSKRIERERNEER